MFSIERSSDYAWLKRKPSMRSQANEALDKKIIQLFHDHKSRSGSPRITKDLQELGESCSKNRVARRMRHLSLRAKPKRKIKVTTDSKRNLPVAANLLNRNFSATAPNQKYVGDITYIWTSEGWL
jgi:transposase InsO family protein